MAITAVEAATTSLEPAGEQAGRLAREEARLRAAELFNEYGTLVERVCRGLLRDDFEAEDAAQQTFLSAYKALVDGNLPRDGEAWLATIARNECLQRIRSRMRQPLPVLDLELEDGRPDVHQLAAGRVDANRLWREIARLPERQRDAVILREIAGLSYAELGAVLGLERPAVESLLFRARGRLRSRLGSALASVNLAGFASEVAAALARLAGPSAAPLAVKATAVGIGVAVVGGGNLVTERGLGLRPAAAAQMPARVTHTVRLSPPRPAPPPVVPVHIAAASTPSVALPRVRQDGRDDQRSARDGTRTSSDSRGDDRVAIVTGTPPPLSTGRDRGGDGSNEGEHASGSDDGASGTD